MQRNSATVTADGLSADRRFKAQQSSTAVRHKLRLLQGSMSGIVSSAVVFTQHEHAVGMGRRSTRAVGYIWLRLQQHQQHGIQHDSNLHAAQLVSSSPSISAATTATVA